jgi:hypothetical protein
MRIGAFKFSVLLGLTIGVGVALAAPLPARASSDSNGGNRKTICSQTNCIDPYLCGYTANNMCTLGSPDGCTVRCCDPPGCG